MNELLKKQMEEQFELAVNEAFENNPMKGTPFEGMAIHSAIGDVAGYYKTSFFDEKGAMLGITKTDFNAIVDEVSHMIIHKYLKM